MNQLIAYELKENVLAESGWKLVPASKTRDWMGANDSHAYRCLPLVIANQLGWVVLNPVGFTATWNGAVPIDDAPTAIKLEFDEPLESEEALNAGVQSDFGNGILTFSLPYLFRTPTNMNLIVRGPSNQWKLHASPLDGLVETDWLPFTFTMNWKLTVPNQPVRFEKGEPICQFYPLETRSLEQYDAVVESIQSNPELVGKYKNWLFMRYVQRHTAQAKELNFMENRYMKGKDFEGLRKDDHLRSLKLSTFKPVAGDDDGDVAA